MRKFGWGLLLLLVSLSVSAKTSLWKVSKEDKVLYLGGTIHVLNAEDYPLPCEYESAYTKSQVLIFETDVAAMQSPVFAQNSMHKLMYTNGENLTEKLSSETRQALENYLLKIGMSLAQWQYFKPGMLMSMMLMAELNTEGKVVQGVDEYYTSRATGEGKVIEYFESPDEQIDFVANMGIGNEEKFIRYLLESVEDTNTLFPLLKTHWREGDLAGLSKSSELPLFRSEFPRVFESLLTQRNNAWISKIETMLTTDEIEYVLVGALHMAEDVGLLAQLKEKGFQVAQLDGCQAD